MWSWQTTIPNSLVQSPTAKTIALNIVTNFLKHRLILSDIPKSVWSQIDLHVVNMFSVTLEFIVGVEKVETAAYHPKINWQEEMYTWALVACPGNYMIDLQKDWDI